MFQNNMMFSTFLRNNFLIIMWLFHIFIMIEGMYTKHNEANKHCLVCMNWLHCTLNLVWGLSLLSTTDETIGCVLWIGFWDALDCTLRRMNPTQVMLRRSSLINWRGNEGFIGINCTMTIAWNLDMLPRKVSHMLKIPQKTSNYCIITWTLHVFMW